MTDDATNNTSDATDAPDTSALVRALVSLVPQKANADAVRLLIGGDKTLSKLPEVAEIFGNSPNTVKQAWRQAGMPGEIGKWDLVDIVCWVIDRNASNRKTGEADDNKRKAKADADRAELAAERERLALEAQRGSVIDAREARAQIRERFSLFREHSLGVSRSVLPLLPQECAISVTEDIDKQVRRHLAVLIESLMKGICPTEGESDDESA